MAKAIRRPTPSTDEHCKTLAEFIAHVSPTTQREIPGHLDQLIALFERALTKQTFAVVSMPPRHAKTTTVRRALAYAIKRFPDRLNALGMYAEPSALNQSRQVRKLARAQGVALEPDAQTLGLWLTPQEGGLFAAGAHGQWTGKGIGGIAVMDDLLKGREVAESPAMREKIWDTFTDDIITRLEPPVGSMIVVATRWHEDDPCGRIAERSGKGDFPTFEFINLPALRVPGSDPYEPSEADDAVALWPERFPREQLVQTRAILGPYGWRSLYQGSPTAKGGSVFKQEPSRFTGSGRDGRRIVLSLDGAGTEDTRADYTVCLALAFAGNGPTLNVNVVDMLRMQLEPQDSARKLRKFVDDNGGGTLHIESTRDGKAIAKALRAIDSSLRIEYVTPIGDKFTRAQPVAAAWNAPASRVALPADATAYPWVKDFLAEARTFTGMGDKHDDIVDAMSQAWNIASKAGGIGFADYQLPI